jgi:hypothetical protein
MADNLPVRITGQVLDVSTRSGTSKHNGQPYRLHTVSVLVGMMGVVPVTFPDDYVDGVPRVSDLVDVLAQATVYAPVSPQDGRPTGRADMQFRAAKPFPAELPAFV